MANKLRDSFDWYGAVNQAVNGIWNGFGLATLSATTRFGAGQSISLPTTNLQVGPTGVWSSTTDQMFIHLTHAQTAALGGGTACQSLRFYDGLTRQFAFRFLDNGSISIYRGDDVTLLGTYLNAFGGSTTWSHFEIKVILSATVGEFHFRKNGSNVDNFALTGVNNAPSGNNRTTGMDTICRTTASAVQLFDDVWIYDNQNLGDGAPFDYIGDVRPIQIVANGDTFTQFSRSAGVTNFSNIDELINSTTDYNFSNTAGQYDEYSNAGWGAFNPASILGLSIRGQMLKDNAGPREVACRLRSGASVVQGESITAASNASSSPVWAYIDLDPATSAPWSQAGVAAAVFGPIVTV